MEPGRYTDGAFAWPSGNEHGVRTTDGARLWVADTGEGRPVVLAHGYSTDSRMWSLVVPELVASGYRVVVADQRGHGRSGVGSSGFGIAQLGSDLVSVIAHLDLTDAIVVGHSMGGIGLQRALIDHGDELEPRLRGVVLASTLHRSPASLMRLRVRTGLMGLPAADRARRVRWLGRLLARRAYGVDPPPELVDAALGMVLECPIETARGALLPIMAFDHTEGLGTVRHPALVICGTHDRVTPPAASRVIAGLLDDVRTRWLPNCGHAMPYERPTQMVEAISWFDREIDRDRSQVP